MARGDVYRKGELGVHRLLNHKVKKLHKGRKIECEIFRMANSKWQWYFFINN